MSVSDGIKKDLTFNFLSATVLLVAYVKKGCFHIMKKFFVTLLSLLLTFTLMACGNDTSTPDSNDDANVSENGAEETQEEAQQEETETPQENDDVEQTEPTEDNTDNGTTSNDAYISASEAEEIALSHVSGTVLQTELDTEDGITYFEVYVQTDSGVSEVYINAQTGELIRIDAD